MAYQIKVVDYIENREKIEEFLKEAYEELIVYYPSIKKPEFNLDRSAYEYAYNIDTLRCFFLYRDDVLIGYCGMFIGTELFTSLVSAQDDVMFISQGDRNTIGRYFAEMVEIYLKENGVKVITISTPAKAGIRKFWEYRGYLKVADHLRKIL